MNTFKKKYNNKAVKDNGSYMSKEAKSFVTSFRNMLKRQLNPYGIEVVNFTDGHYYCSGFVKCNNTYIYISYNIPRYEAKIDFTQNGAVLYRFAKDEKDYTGEYNQYTSLEKLPDTVIKSMKTRTDITEPVK